MKKHKKFILLLTTSFVLLASFLAFLIVQNQKNFTNFQRFEAYGALQDRNTVKNLMIKYGVRKQPLTKSQLNHVQTAATRGELNYAVKQINRHSSYAYVTPKNSKVWPRVHLLKHQITYISIPPFNSNSRQKRQAYAQTIAQALSHAKKGVILDFRGNNGGLQEPMLLGLYPLLKNQTLFSEVTQQQIKYPVTLKNSTLTGGIPADPKAKLSGTINSINQAPVDCSIQPNLKVAVLIDNHTASSAELCVLALLNHSSTKLFGQSTAGYTSVNASRTFESGSTKPIRLLNLTVGWLEPSDKASKHLRNNHTLAEDQILLKNQKIKPDVYSKRPESKALDWLSSN